MKLTNIINQMYLGDMYKIFHAKKENISTSHRFIGSSPNLTINSIMKKASTDTETSKLCLASYQTTVC